MNQDEIANLSDVLELYLFFKTHQEDLGFEYDFTHEDLQKSFIEKNHQYLTYDYLILIIQLTLYNNFIQDTKTTIPYYKWLATFENDYLLNCALIQTREIFFQKLIEVGKIKNILRKLENEGLNQYNNIFSTCNFQTYTITEKIQFLKFLKNYVFHECQFVQQFINNCKFAQQYINCNKEKFLNIQIELKAKTEQLIMQNKDFQQSHNKLSEKKNAKSQFKETQKLEFDIEKNEEKILAYQNVIDVSFEDFSVFFLYGYSIITQNSQKYILVHELLIIKQKVIKDIKNAIFQKEIKNGNQKFLNKITGDVKIKQYQKYLQVHVSDILINGSEQQKQKINLLKQMKYFTELTNNDIKDERLVDYSLKPNKDDLNDLKKIQFNLQYVILDMKENDLIKNCQKILIEAEDIFHNHFFSQQGFSWASQDDRYLWRKELEASDQLDDLVLVAKKLPQQLSYVSDKTKIFDEKEQEDRKEKSSQRGEHNFHNILVSWFYQNSFNTILGQIIKYDFLTLDILNGLCITIYYIILKFTSQKSQKNIKSTIQEDQKILPDRLRNRQTRIVYDEHENQEDLSRYSYQSAIERKNGKK